MFILLVLYEMHVKTPSMECQKVIRSELPGAFSVACTRCTRRGAGAAGVDAGGPCRGGGIPARYGRRYRGVLVK